MIFKCLAQQIIYQSYIMNYLVSYTQVAIYCNIFIIYILFIFYIIYFLLYIKSYHAHFYYIAYDVIPLSFKIIKTYNYFC